MFDVLAATGDLRQFASRTNEEAGCLRWTARTTHSTCGPETRFVLLGVLHPIPINKASELQAAHMTALRRISGDTYKMRANKRVLWRLTGYL